MRISNPKTTAGGLPLATTWYVNTRFEGTKKFIIDVATDLSGYVDQQVGAAVQAAINRENSISALSDQNDAALSATSELHDAEIISAFCRYITGTGDLPAYVKSFVPTTVDSDPAIYYEPKPYGYAYLAENKKIDPSLIPDISIMDVNVVDIADIFNYLKANAYLEHGDDKELYQLITNGVNGSEYSDDNIIAIANTFTRALEIYILENQSLTGEIKAVGKGDVVIVTNFGVKAVESELNSEAYSVFKDVFSQSFACGAWICKDETRKDNGLNESVSYVKISYNQGEIVSVNKIVPSTDGDITIDLANVYKVGGIQKLGQVLAKNIQMVKNTATDTEAMQSVNLNGGLVAVAPVSDRFVFENAATNCCHAYTTIEQYMTLNVATEVARAGLSAAIDAEFARATSVENFLSGAIDAEVARSTAEDERAKSVENYLSGVIGTEADISGTVSNALLALKSYAETTNDNVVAISDAVNTTDYDVLKVFTYTIEAGAMTDVKNALEADGYTATTVSYVEAHAGWDSTGLYENNIYNYFGFKANDTFVTPDVSEITIAGFKGRILDIHVFNTETGKYEKIDADVNYEIREADDHTFYHVASFTILGEYDRNTTAPASTLIDKLVIRYTNKFEYTPAPVNGLFN